MSRRVRVGRQINGVVFGLSTPRRHGNAKSADFLNEAGLNLHEPWKWGDEENKPLSGTRPTMVIIDDLLDEDLKKEKD